MFKKVLRSNAKFWIAATIFYAIVILMLSIRSNPSEIHAGPRSGLANNVGHVPAYAILTFLIIQCLSVFGVKARLFIYTFVIVVAYGILMEILQSFTPDRSPQLLDVFLDSLGTLAMIFFYAKGWLDQFSYSGYRDRVL